MPGEGRGEGDTKGVQEGGVGCEEGGGERAGEFDGEVEVDRGFAGRREVSIRISEWEGVEDRDTHRSEMMDAQA